MVYAVAQAGSIRVASTYIVECAFDIARHAFLHAALIQRLGIFGRVLLHGIEIGDGAHRRVLVDQGRAAVEQIELGLGESLMAMRNSAKWRGPDRSRT